MSPYEAPSEGNRISNLYYLVSCPIPATSKIAEEPRQANQPGTPHRLLDATLPLRMLQFRDLPANRYVPATDCKVGTSALTYERLERRSSLPSVRRADPGQNMSGSPAS